MSIDLIKHENGNAKADLFIEKMDMRMKNKLLRSGEVQEIISRKAGFAQRWALSIFLLILFGILFGTWVIRYPDIIVASATLTATNGPKEIVVRQDGKLEHLFVANDDTIVQGQMIAWIESTAGHQQVLDLSGLLQQAQDFLAKNEPERVSSLFTRPFRDLGEIQPAYQLFITAWQQFSDYLVNGYYFKRKNMLYDDYRFLQHMHEILLQQRELARQDLQLVQESFQASDTLYSDKVISRQDMRDQKSKLIGKQQSIPQLESSLLTNENQQTAKQKDIDELEHTIAQQKAVFQQSLQTLKSAADDWQKKYIIRAPINGKIVFIVPLQENQFMQSGKTIGFVNPGNGRYYAQVNLPQNNFGKIQSNQKVQLQFDAYPYQEFGVIEGRVQYISKIPSDSGFLGIIELPKGLITSYHKTIQYRAGLKSQALIITRDERLIKRFYYTIVKETQR